MKKIIISLFCLVVMAGSSLKAQDLTLNDVLLKYYKIMGMDKLKDVNSFVLTAKTSGQGMELPVVSYYKRPGKIRTEVEIQGNKMITVFDGISGWSISPWSGSSEPQDMTADDVKAMKEQADFEGALYNWQQKGNKLDFMGKEDMDGSPVYKIKITKANGNTETDFLDADSFIPVKTQWVVKYQGNDVEGETIPGNYKDVDGILLPFSIENKFKGQSSGNVLVDKYEINKEINDSIFQKPVKK